MPNDSLVLGQRRIRTMPNIYGGALFEKIVDGYDGL